MLLAIAFPKIRFIESIIIWARRRCKTCWHCALPIRCLNPCGVEARSTTCKLPWPKISALADALNSTTASARCVTWFQNHMLQLVCLFAMEPPSSPAPRRRSRRKDKGPAFSEADFHRRGAPPNSVRGQYTAGAIKSSTVPGYIEERDGDSSTTETFVALKLRDRKLALVERAVLPSHRQTAARQTLRDRRAVPRRAALNISRTKIQRIAQPATHSLAAR